MNILDTIIFNLQSIKNDTVITCIASMQGNIQVCKCVIYTDNSHKTWTISSWFTLQGYNGHGIGRATLNKILKYLYGAYGKPSKIEYIWNGTNEYVFDWLVNHFDAVCKCPIAVQKTQADDDWSSHIYELNVTKVLKYFRL